MTNPDQARVVGEQINGKLMTLQTALHVADDAQLSPREQREIQTQLQRYRENIGRIQASSYEDTSAVLVERHREIDEHTSGLNAWLESVGTSLARGEISGAAARADLVDILRIRTALAQRAEQLRADDERSWQAVQQDEGEWQADVVARYPALATHLPAWPHVGRK